MVTVNRSLLAMALAQAIVFQIQPPPEPQHMKIKIEVTDHQGEEDQAGHMEVLMIDKGQETVLGGLSEKGDFFEVEIEFPQAIVVRPAQN